MATLVDHESFEGTLAAYSTTGSPATSTDDAMDGTNSLKIAANGTVAQYVQYNPAAGWFGGTCQFYWKSPASAPSGTSSIIQVSNANGNVIIQLLSTMNARLQVGGTNGANSTALTASRWHRIDLKFDFSTGTATATWTITDLVTGTVMANYTTTHVQTSAQIGNVRLGQTSLIAMTSYYDTWTITDSTADYPLAKTTRALSAVGAVASGEAFGTTVVGLPAYPITAAGAIASGEAFGTATVALAVTHGTFSFYITARQLSTVDGDGYRANLRVNADSTVDLLLEKVVSGAVTVLATATNVATHAANQDYGFRFACSGLNPTGLKAKAWVASGAEPGWLVTATDSEATLQVAGRTGLRSFDDANWGSGTTVASWDNLQGITTPDQAVTAAGAIDSAEDFGVTDVEPGLVAVSAVGAIGTGEAFGASVVGATFPITAAGAIASAGALGTPVVALPAYPITTVSISSGEAFGTAAVAIGAITVTSAGAIGSAEAFGTPVVTIVAYPISAVGGIASGEAFGTTVVAVPPIAITGAGGIASGESFGTAAVVIFAVQAPRGGTGAIEYVIEIYDSGGTFGPNNRLGEIWDFRNVGWSRYDRLPGKAFATLYQSSPHLSKFSPLTTHVRIWRVTPTGDTEVYNGRFIDYDSTGDDVILTFFDYISELAVSRTGYRTLYPTKLLGTEIVSPEITTAIGKTFSPLGFVAIGTIENPVGQDGTTPIKTNATFGLLDQMRLQLFYDLSEMGRANTVNQVTYEITRTAPFTFNFWKNKGNTRNMGLVLNGNVSDYKYLPNWGSYRNDLASLGTTVGGGATEIVKTNESAAAVRGRRQDVATIKTVLGITSSTVEADQQQAAAARMLNVAVQKQPALSVQLVRGTIAPFSGWDINDRVPVEIVNGIDNITADQRIVGVRALFSEVGEDLGLVLEPILT